MFPPSADFAQLVKDQHYPKGALFVVATPIGNLADISVRALWTLGQCQVLACEDTRTTRHLLRQYGFDLTQFQYVSVHQHNEEEALAEVLQHLARGARVALLSDAGTPAISDPGSRLVSAAGAAGYAVIPLPGASAMVSALSICGWEAAASCFIGFLPASKNARLEALKHYQNFVGILIAFEAPHRIHALIGAMQEIFPAQTAIVLARELTKQFETVHRSTLGELTDLSLIPERGEFVVLLRLIAPEHSAQLDDKVLQCLMAELPLAQAVRLSAQITGARKNALYNRALAFASDASDSNDASLSTSDSTPDA